MLRLSGEPTQLTKEVRALRVRFNRSWTEWLETVSGFPGLIIGLDVLDAVKTRGFRQRCV